MPSVRRLRNTTTLPVPTPSGPAVPAERAVVGCGVYVDGVREQGHVTHRTAIERVRETGRGFVWIGLHDPDRHQMDTVASAFGLHELIAEDATSGRQRPKLEAYDDTVVLTMSTVEYLEHRSVADATDGGEVTGIFDTTDIVSTGEIMVILGRDFVITVRHGDIPALSGLRAELEGAPERLSRGPAVVMHAVADRVVDGYLEVAERMSREIDDLEIAVFAPRTPVGIEQIYVLKRELLELKHDIAPLALPLRHLSVEHVDLIPSEVRHYFRDVQDHHTRVAAEVTTLDEQITSLVHAAMAMIGVQQNTDMRRISAWVAIAVVPTMIAGIYGMNFTNMPELRTEYGYYVVLGVMAAACTALFLLFRRNRWL
ncbi:MULTISPECIES: magnesium and cobalt transport protein CorA [unclassified Dietzia]|uniref:magnesium and cobalt transport protein CorA n=1 Tax=Dietzia sp. DQ12-45-1b TaxID=912801 RepID=UPI00131690A3|nr:magnesium and cobalt transport protein CorA [Dietzia sp. DQ12-45-1b]